MNAITERRCYGCNRTRGLTIDGKGNLSCEQHWVPDIHDPSWPGYRAATEDILVAPPNAKNVTPKALRG